MFTGFFPQLQLGVVGVVGIFGVVVDVVVVVVVIVVVYNFYFLRGRTRVTSTTDRWSRADQGTYHLGTIRQAIVDEG